jgi:hypothetical protein
MSALSSIFSSGSTVTVRNDKPKRRDSSVKPGKKRNDFRRTPAIEIVEDRDVGTMVCIELSKRILVEPNINLGVFLKTASNSRRDICLSDATLMLAAAILEHIGNSRLADSILKNSATVTNFYQKMNLDQTVVREVFVTLIFSIAPEFVKMIEATLQTVIERASKETMTPHGEYKLANALTSLTQSGAITQPELLAASQIGSTSPSDRQIEYKRESLQRTPTEMIGPEDSASVLIPRSRRRGTIIESDIQNYINRKKSGHEPEFEEVFRSAEKPVTIQRQEGRTGVGYKALDDSKRISEINKILGMHAVKTVDLKTGEVRHRRPTVMDYIESESISTSVLEAPPDVSSQYDPSFNYRKVSPPSPTELFLPNSLVESPKIMPQTLRPVDSYEELMASLRVNT